MNSPHILTHPPVRPRYEVLSVYLVLAGLTWIVFGQTLVHAFVAYDDQNYVYENSQITAGLTVHGFANAFSHSHARNWHPLTTISHMLDCQLFGLDPAGPHLVNVLLHVAAVLLLFSVLRAMTGELWRCALVAAVFAVHPLRAESVAWIAERKDVLSGVFFMLTIAAYVHYVRRPSWTRYLCTAFAFTLGLMSKPMLVTLPLVLLLLDYWPLNRFDGEHSKSHTFDLILEKFPMLLLSGASCVATFVAQRSTIDYANQIRLTARLANASISYVVYVEQMFWPTKLAVAYPYAGESSSALEITLAFLFLVAISAFAFVMRRRFPYISVGWFWYLICLVPVIGLVQVGLQGHADRYTYLSQIGLCIVVTWSVSDLLGSFSKRREILVGVTAIFIGLLTWRGWIQTSYWRNTQSLWAHVLEVQPASDLAHYNIAADLLSQNRVDDAIAHYKKALAARQGKGRSPYQLSSAIIHNALGNAFAQKECYDDALVQYRAAVECDPNFADAHSNVATLLTRRGDISGALAESEKALSIPPEDAPSHVRLGTLLLQSGRESFALAHYRRALELDPESRDAATGISQCSQLASSKVR